MRILFSSDIHGEVDAFETYAEVLSKPEFDMGVLGGGLFGERVSEDRVQEAAEIVQRPKKPIVLVLGNHDLNEWPETELITNIHMKSVVRCGWWFAGYRWTPMDREPRKRRRDVRRLRRLVNSRTILVTHAPPAGTLDGTERGQTGYGCPELAQLGRRPWLHLVGHVHDSAGQDGITVNGAYKTLKMFFAIDVELRTVERIS